MLGKADVIEFIGEQPRTIRVLWISRPNQQCVVIDMEAELALPEFLPVPGLEEALASGEATLLSAAVGMNFKPESQLTAAEVRGRDRAWSLIGELVVIEPKVYAPTSRAKLIQDAVEKARSGSDRALNRVTKKLFYGWLRRYWRGGMVKAALVPKLENCGAPGKTRAAGERKRGRPRKYGASEGLNITPEFRKIFQLGFDRCYASDRKRNWSLKDAYNKIIEDFFCDKQIDSETGKVVHVLPKDDGVDREIPTYRQFQYWADKDHCRLEVKRRRIGARIYDKDLRGLLGTSNSEVMGPGDRYQIDATIADVYLLSRLDRTRIIGRPVIYIVIDVFSRMIVGVYVGLEGPSWVGAMAALANTVADKVSFCADFGIEIAPDDWPCQHLPGILLGDRGEIEGSLIDTLLNTFNLTVENAAAYRGDWKGIVERRFGLLPAIFKPYVPGYIEQDFRARGGSDYRLDATFDLTEFTQIIIECVLYYNNYHEIARYDADRDVLADGVPPIPSELWDWGRTHRSGAMRSFPEEMVKFALLPRETASVTEFGIRHRGRFYTTPTAVSERWFDRARQNGRWTIQVAYDPRCVDAVYLDAKDSGQPFQVCTLTDRSRAAAGLSLCELDQQDQANRQASAGRANEQLLARIDLNASMGKRQQEALARKPATTDSKAKRTAAIRSNREDEKQANRDAEAFRLGRADPAPGAASAAVIEFPGGGNDEPDYSLPSLDDILGGGDDE